MTAWGCTPAAKATQRAPAAITLQPGFSSSAWHEQPADLGLIVWQAVHLQAVYTALREAEYRSTAFVPYWKVGRAANMHLALQPTPPLL